MAIIDGVDVDHCRPTVTMARGRKNYFHFSSFSTRNEEMLKPGLLSAISTGVVVRNVRQRWKFDAARKSRRTSGIGNVAARSSMKGIFPFIFLHAGEAACTLFLLDEIVFLEKAAINGVTLREIPVSSFQCLCSMLDILHAIFPFHSRRFPLAEDSINSVRVLFPNERETAAGYDAVAIYVIYVCFC